MALNGRISVIILFLPGTGVSSHPYCIGVVGHVREDFYQLQPNDDKLS